MMVCGVGASPCAARSGLRVSRSTEVTITAVPAGTRTRRGMIRSWTALPHKGRSLTRRRYRLCTRREVVPQDGQTPDSSGRRIVIVVTLGSLIALTTTNPLGTKEDAARL